MTQLRLRSLLLLAALAPALLLPLACKKRYEPRAIEWRIDPGATLRLDARMEGNLRIVSSLYRGSIPEVVTYGVLSANSVIVQNPAPGSCLLVAPDAELYISDTQPIEIVGRVEGSVRFLNHHAPVTVKGRVAALEMRNQKGLVTIEEAQNVRIENLEGELRLLEGVDGRVQASNVEGEVSAVKTWAALDLNGLKGRFIGRDLVGEATLGWCNGVTSISSQNDVKLLAFSSELDPHQRAEDDMTTPQDIERVLGAQGRTIAIRTSGSVTLKDVTAKEVRIEGADGLVMHNYQALQTELVGVKSSALRSMRGPLRLVQCQDGLIAGCDDFELTRCFSFAVSPLPAARGHLKDCRQLILWGASEGAVAQDNCENVVFAPRSAPREHR